MSNDDNTQGNQDETEPIESEAIKSYSAPDGREHIFQIGEEDPNAVKGIRPPKLEKSEE